MAAIVIARDYSMGTAGRMGPGYFPRGLGSILILLGLILDVKPDEREYCYQRQSRHETTELVTALCQLGNEHDNRCGYEVLGYEPRHNFSSGG